MRNRRVGVLMGGLSSERQVSLATGEAVAASLADLGYEVEPIYVDRDVDLVLRQSRIDVAFLALHGRYGEDGCIQGLLEILGIPYTGSDVLGSALAMNKVKAKELFRLHNLPTPAYYVLERDDQDDVAGCHGDFGFPAVVKPVAEGSSVGVELVEDAAHLVLAAERAFCFDDRVLVERFIDGKEVSVAVLGDRAIGAVEIAPRTQALRAHRALGCSGATRVDMMVAASGNEYVLEVNTVPGLTPTSLLPKIAGSVGISFGELCEGILAGARLHAAGRGHGDRRIAQRPYDGDERRESLPEHH